MNREKLLTKAVNCLASLDMKYTLVSDEHDEMLATLQAIDEYIETIEKGLKHNIRSAKWILGRFKLPDGLKEELDEIVRVSEIKLGER